MDAMGIANRREFTDDISMFYARTGLLCLAKQLEWLDLPIKDAFGLFDESQIEMLVDFCSFHHEFHIISGTNPGWLENRYVTGQRTYYLGNGDKDPNFVLNIFLKGDAHLFAEATFEEALAIVSSSFVATQ